MLFSELKNILNHNSVSREKVIKLLSQLTDVENSDGMIISKKEYADFFSNLQYNNHIYVMQTDEEELVGMATIIVENKLIHGGSKVAHIEDVVIHKKYRGLGYGKLLLDNLINKSKNFGCYKIILNCHEKNIGFYEKAGFQQKNIEMSLYL
tara:strand:- start:75 stop:527 length:453 start_codon:yes stop_codon:yes gene_type:complete